jgi:hypothetical protein
MFSFLSRFSILATVFSTLARCRAEKWEWGGGGGGGGVAAVVVVGRLR